jgi:tryptophan synthase alpha chain
VRAATTLPVAVGFGVSTPEHAAVVARIADGVVVGSACVRRQTDVAELESFVAALASAVAGAVESGQGPRTARERFRRPRGDAS